MSAAARLRLTFFLPDAAADWAGAALPDLFPDGLLLRPSRGGVTCLQGWLPLGQARRQGEARRRLSELGATRVSVRRVTVRPPRALHGRFPILRLPPFVIIPAARLGQAKLRPGELPIVLIQGQAFGTGLHESTRLMLAQVRAIVAADVEASVRPLSVLDIGAGSGILGFACLRMGAAAVTSVEVESPACAELRENRSLNQVPPRRLPVHCGRYPLARLRGRCFPLVLGNLVTPVLLALMPQLAGQVASGGLLLLSGIHTRAEVAKVTAAASAAGLRRVARSSLHDWHVLRFLRP